jgi:hypothetical protein
MSTRALVIWIVVIAALVGATLVFGGDGHRAIAKWLPAMHGGRR